MCLTLFCDVGHCAVTLLLAARCLAPASAFPKGQCDRTPICHFALTNHGGVGQGDSRALALLTLPGEKRLLWAAVSCESLPRPTRHSLGARRGVSRGTPDSDCPWHPRAQSAYTHLTLRSMGELFAARQGRSAWGTVLPLGQVAVQNLPFQTRSSLLNFSQLSRASPSRTPARLLARQPRSGFCSEGWYKALLELYSPLGVPSLAARPLPDSTVSARRHTQWSPGCV